MWDKEAEGRREHLIPLQVIQDHNETMGNIMGAHQGW